MENKYLVIENIDNARQIELSPEEYERVNNILYFCEECNCSHLDLDYTFEQLIAKL